MKFTISLFLLLPIHLFSQSVTAKDLIKFLNQSWRSSRNYLVTHSFSAPIIKVMNNDTLTTFSNTVEYITLGGKWKTSDDKKLDQVSYMTKDSLLVAKLVDEIKREGFADQSSNYNPQMKANVTFLEDQNYIVQIVFTEEKRRLNSISFIKK